MEPGNGPHAVRPSLLTGVSHVETVTLDIEGRALACTDARGNTVYSATWRVPALPLATYDARDAEDDIIETVREWSIYGERATDAADDNRLGTVWRAFDAAGMVESTGFTFAGQPLGSVRRLTSGWVGQPDWTNALRALPTSVSAAQTEADTLLETTAYATAMTWDALGRPVTTTSPAESGRGCIRQTFLNLAHQTFWTSTERLGYTAAPSPPHSSHETIHHEAPSHHR